VYDTQVVEQRLEIARQELGFRPEYHSVSEVQDFNARLAKQYAAEYQVADAAGQGAKEPAKAYQLSLLGALANPENPRLSQEEVRWMKNERALCQCDAAYFMTRYYWIKNWKNELQRFTFQAAQKVYFDVVAGMERRGASIEFIACKGRQLGVSTETEGLIAQRSMFSYGVNATIASFDQSKTAEMAKMLFLGYDLLPWWMRPVHTRRVESDRGMLQFGGLKSGVLFQHGLQTSGISQGTTPTLYHLSEVAYYPNPEALIEVGLFKAVHASPKVFGVLESTAAGDTGWWPDTYWYAKRQWPLSRLYALFLPWWLGTDLYPNETWLKLRPVPERWRPMAETQEMAAKAKLFAKSSPMLEGVIGTKWEMSRGQMWWWEKQLLEARYKGKEKTFFQEYPTDDRDAFQGSYDNVFGRPTIAEAWSARKKQYAVFGIVGQSVEARFEPDPDEIDESLPRIPVTYKSHDGKVYRWELVPLKWKEEFSDLDEVMDSDAHQGKLFVWEFPRRGFDYSIGVDTSNGLSQDNTCIAGHRRSRGQGEPYVQVAEFRSNVVSHVDAYPFVLCIAAFYAQFMPETTAYKEPYVSVEQILAVGDTCQLQMRKMGYSRFHKMIRYDSKDIKKSKSRKLGWFSFGWSRPMLTDGFVVTFQNGWCVIHSPWTLWEMEHWEVHITASGKEKKEHSSDATDDGIFANAMAVFCPEDIKSMAERSKKRCQDGSGGELPPVDIDVWGGQSFPRREIPSGGWLQ
jgi:hypothetical protein